MFVDAGAELLAARRQPLEQVGQLWDVSAGKWGVASLMSTAHSIRMVAQHLPGIKHLAWDERGRRLMDGMMFISSWNDVNGVMGWRGNTWCPSIPATALALFPDSEHAAPATQVGLCGAQKTTPHALPQHRCSLACSQWVMVAGYRIIFWILLVVKEKMRT